MGTAFIVTEECQVHENYKNEIIRARDIDSKVTGRSCGHPVRTLRNQMTKLYLQKEKEGASFEELEALTLGGLKKAVVEGDVKNGSLMAGQSAGLVTEKMTCEMLIRKLVKGTEKQIRGMYFMSKTAFIFPGRAHRQPEWEKISMRTAGRQKTYLIWRLNYCRLICGSCVLRKMIFLIRQNIHRRLW